MKQIHITLTALFLGVLLPVQVASQSILIIPIQSQNPEESKELIQELKLLLKEEEPLSAIHPKALFDPEKSTFKVAEWQRQTEAGVENFIDTEFVSSIEILTGSLEVIEKDPSLLYLNPRMTVTTQTGGLTLVRALLQENREEEAKRWMTTLIQIFPDPKRGLKIEDSAPEVIELYKALNNAPQTNKKNLSVQVDTTEKNCTIFLNGVDVISGQEYKVSIPKGIYYLRAQCGSSTSSMVYRVELQDNRQVVIFPGQEENFNLQPRLLLKNSDPNIPESFSNASQLLSSLSDANIFLFAALVESEKDKDTKFPYFQLTSFDREGNHLNSARIGTDRLQDPEKLRELVRVVLKDGTSKDIEIYQDDQFQVPLNKPKRIWTWVTIGAGVIALAGSVVCGEVALSKSEEIHNTQGTQNDLTSSDSLFKASNGFLIGGIALIATGIVLFFIEGNQLEKEPDTKDIQKDIQVGVTTLPDGGMFLFQVSF